MNKINPLIMSFESSVEINSYSGKFLSTEMLIKVHVEQLPHFIYFLFTEVEDSLEEVDESLIIDETRESLDEEETDGSGMLSFIKW